MGIRSTRPLPLAYAELEMAPFFKRRFRSWHLEHVRLVLQRYRLLTSRFCVDALQLGSILGIKEKKLVEDVMSLFLPRTPTRVQCMVDVMEVLIALVLVCQAPNMLQRFEMIFDIIDLEGKGAISSIDLIMLCGAVGRAITKLFEYNVEPEQHAMMAYIADVLDSLGVARDGKITKEVLCKFMLSDRFAVHYVKQCTGQDKPKLYIMLEKDTEFLGAVEFSNVKQMQASSLRTVRDMIYRQKGKENEVEVFPVLVIRPIEEKISVTEPTNTITDENVRPSVNGDDDAVLLEAKTTDKKPPVASKSYLTEFEYDISSTESNFEALYQHITSGIMQDAFWLNRRDVMGRTMLHDAAEFGTAEGTRHFITLLAMDG
ncbi:hypothetical protein BBO99_00005475 [Phytophthora kernoviae]|uniref:EF-hand domain-containing protein n=2 Tax=Phytophthora kernoviae TaxID=325452 RepID=A0A3R7H9U1_9STRA|nr:hypothetical protein G195_004818 [Phytophthora kernoviae 00238/432]KAG2523301.1 hypothetical protein JM16_004014 [Phytophthora kernoviae]KAG2525147.1 hypothetical protein JM18_003573 [Phytophthora kernoviae]RLN37992.1 hypothetical protein BBI17_002299 [Phytophthora kernoviae]RLN79156.1 hypothetical protein BBO99_00005475 [Phytophthora kernoviae]